MSSNTKSILFAIVLCFVCSLLLTIASSGLKSYQVRNINLDRHKNLLKSAGLIDDQDNNAPAYIEKLYSENIKSLWVDSSGRIVKEPERGEKALPIYLYIKRTEIESYIVPINAQGLWGKINGYLALSRDGSTVSGFTVYKHSETPGLGGEIERSWFQKNFKGKKIVNKEGKFVSISIARGAVKDVVQEDLKANFVDGISGATLTGKFLSASMKDILKEYESVSVKFRQNMFKEIPGSSGAVNQE
ncbi:MAG: FMN-binding protein [Desulfobacteraceae bacterium]|nr:MAG: FMN-binding protein [Desulfobacteraceae bacterium]